MTATYEDVLRFHTHECPGIAVGYRIAELAAQRFGRHSFENELVATAETDSCALDAIQVLTGCTFGKGNLVHVDNGKYTFSFWRRFDGAGIKISARPNGDAYRDEQTWALYNRIQDGTATGADRALFSRLQTARVKRILAAPVEALLVVAETTDAMPERHRLKPSAPCAGCGDLTGVDILHDHRGRMLCPPCHLRAHGGVLPPDHGHHHHSPPQIAS
ncbi:MAG TPA: FmdE family protein [Actinophytocola sp.]|uniref:FmdE family protein n=1 Tax=Actinophytocola sp. TaxID=1872138 RepID=UPI002DDCA559|nr:FmdE family protein [Actinophytocola sp.]HEV2778116.1 FmdE family protein [Actinophytocola sp.]